MNPTRANELAKRLADAFGAWDRINSSTLAIYAERMEPWDEALAAEAIENLIDFSRRFPSVIDLREAYAAAGGEIGDPGRSMSPAVEFPEPLTAEEAAQIAELRQEFTKRVHDIVAARSLTPSPTSSTVASTDDR